MSLYLHEDITPEVIREAKKAGITGVKSYPAGVTTNSSSGVLSYEPFYPVFAEMEKQNMILNLHGEVPSTPANTHVSSSKGGAITILNAEPAFLPTFKSLHAKFPNLRIILEHCSTPPRSTPYAPAAPASAEQSPRTTSVSSSTTGPVTHSASASLLPRRPRTVMLFSRRS
jgi:dihydroorotase